MGTLLYPSSDANSLNKNPVYAPATTTTSTTTTTTFEVGIVVKDGGEHSSDSVAQHRVKIVEDHFRFHFFVKLFADFLHLRHFLGQFRTRQFEMCRWT